ncbi:MAG TPA: glutamine synthetase family protein [Xanthobacteraceae bacterium]|nr:glutamine synthetase family protein [Xanthobacteraceae bacterium]
MSRPLGFVVKHNLWTSEQIKLAAELPRRVTAEKLKLVRLAWADSHGASRAKTVTAPVFVDALENGYNINVATSTLDSAGARVFSSFVSGGGMGLDEMTGSPNLIIVPDPATFRVLPWEPEIGWVLCDEYFVNGKSFHFSPRQLLRRQLDGIAQRGMRYRIGLEVEWYLLRTAEENLSAENIGAPGMRGRPIKTAPAEPGYSYHSETNFDLIQAPINALASAYEALQLPLRSLENEWGPGQVECTFAPQDALTAADNFVLFRTATRQICRRLGYFATFMCRPAQKGYYSSGWHLHQSLVDAETGRNLFTPESPEQPLSPLGMRFLGGLLKHAVAATVFGVPTVNGYRRFRPNSLAPDRVVWGLDHRGVLLRVLGDIGSAASRIENRLGEPAANPYLYIMSQLVTGLDGLDNTYEFGPPERDPYTTERPKLPKTLLDALDALQAEPLFRRSLGDVFVEYYLKLKRTEAGRFLDFLKTRQIEATGDETTEWEQNEYFDFF